MTADEIIAKTSLRLPLVAGELLRSVSEALPDLVVFVLDRDGRYVEVLTTQERLLSAEAEALRGKRMHDFLPAHEADGFLEIIRRTIEKQETHTVEYALSFQEENRHFRGRIAPFGVLVEGKPVVVFLAREITDQKRARWAAGAYHAQLMSVFDGIEDVIYVADPDSHELLFVNRAFRKLWGSDPVGRKCHEVLQGRYEPCPFCTNESIFGENFGKHHVWEFQNEKTGRWFRCSDKAIRWPNGKWVRFELASDITEQKRAEERRDLQARVLSTLNRPLEWEDLLRDLLTEIRDFSEVDAVGVRLHEKGAYPYYELSESPKGFAKRLDGLCGADSTWCFVRDGDGHSVFECMCRHVIEGRTDPSQPFFTSYGSFWTNSTSALLQEAASKDGRASDSDRCDREGYESVVLIPLRAGNETIGLLQLNDRRPDRFTPDLIRFFEKIGNSMGIAVTRMRAEEQLRAKEALFRSIFESPMQGILFWDAEGNISEANDAFLDMVGYSREDVLSGSVSWRDMTPPEYHAQDERVLAEIAATGVGAPFEKEYIRKDGSRIPVLLGAASLPGPNLNGVAFMLDISDRKRAESALRESEGQLRQSQKLEALGTLAGGVAHEINNPANAVMNYAQLIKDRQGTRDDTVAEFADEIVRETERIATIVQDLLSFSRRDENHQSINRLSDIVRDSVSLIRTVLRHDQINLVIDVPEELPTIRCRGQQIQQVIMNLITNARDALNLKYRNGDANKKISVAARERDHRGRPVLRITVEDSGPGIPETIRDHIFDPFYTTKPQGKGTGLGLSVSHGIVRDHHGELSVESEPGEWTRFHVDLPVATGDEA